MGSSMSPGQAGSAGDGEGSGREAFGRSRACFEELVTTLAGPDNGRLTHAQMEEQLTALSRELVRTLHQDSLDLRAMREQHRGRVTGSDQVTRGIAEQGHDRGLATVFGEVTVRRMAYRRRGVPNLYPADAVLNLPAVKHSHGLARLAAIEAPRGSSMRPLRPSPAPLASGSANASLSSSRSPRRPMWTPIMPRTGPRLAAAMCCW